MSCEMAMRCLLLLTCCWVTVSAYAVVTAPAPNFSHMIHEPDSRFTNHTPPPNQASDYVKAYADVTAPAPNFSHMIHEPDSRFTNRTPPSTHANNYVEVTHTATHTSTPRPDNDCKNSLHDSIRFGYIGRMKEEIKKSEDIYRADCRSPSPMHTAIENKNVEAVFALADGMFDVDMAFEEGNTVLFFAVKRSGSVSIVRALLELGASPDVVNMNGSTPFLDAFLAERDDMVETLLKHGANLNKKLSNGDTYLHKILSVVDIERVIHLLKLGILIDAENKAGETALGKAVKLNNPALVNLLLSKGADVNKLTEGGQSYLGLAIESRTGLLPLLRHGLSVDALDSNGDTALSKAIEANNTVVVSIFMDFGADLSWTDKSGDTYLHKAVLARNNEILRMLLRAGLQPDERGANGRTPIWLAAVNDFVDQMNLLKEFGADLKQLREGKSLVIWAGQYGSENALVWLATKGLKLDFSDALGWSAIHYAADNGHLQAVKTLIFLGANPCGSTLWGWTPLTLAQRGHHLEIAEVLEQAC